jgi:hypothetical protein
MVIEEFFTEQFFFADLFWLGPVNGKYRFSNLGFGCCGFIA